jgi:hypothetical protein
MYFYTRASVCVCVYDLIFYIHWEKFQSCRHVSRYKLQIVVSKGDAHTLKGNVAFAQLAKEISLYQGYYALKNYYA